MAEKPTAKTAKSTNPARHAQEADRAAFEAGLRVGQRVFLRFAFNETNQVSGEKWYAPPGTRAVVDMIEPCPSGKLFWVAFVARYTVDGEEKKRRACKALAPDVLCATEQEARDASLSASINAFTKEEAV